MNGRKPINKKITSKKPSYHSVPVKKSHSQQPSVGTRVSRPRKNKTPAAVIVSNILMVGVILSICGVVFAVAYNNIEYDKADAARNSLAEAAVVSSVESEPASKPAAASDASGASNTSESASSAASESGSDEPQEELSEDFERDFFRNDLFIGDSIFTGLYLYDHLDRANVAASVGYTPYGAQNMPFDEEYYSGSAVDYAKQFKPTRIIVMLGSNSLTPQTDFDEFTETYKALLDKLKSVCPSSKIIVISVPPITADSSLANEGSHITNAIIDTANGRIRALCVEDGASYFDLNTLLKDENGCFKTEYAEVDGLHFVGKTYKVMLSALQKLLEG